MMSSGAKALIGESVTAETWPRRASHSASVYGFLLSSYFLVRAEVQRSRSLGFSIMETQW